MNTNTEHLGVDGATGDRPYDFAVIGAGILGLSVASEILTRTPDARVIVIEKESVVAAHQTGHNSGVIHSGIYYTPGSLKAQLCVAGAEKIYQYCEQYGVPYERSGKLIVAKNDREVDALRVLYDRGRANNVPGLRWLESHEIAEIEPLCVGKAALHSPNTGIVDYAEVCRSMERELRAKGVEIRLNTEVRRISRSGDLSSVSLGDGTSVSARWAIACAGLWSDELAERSDADSSPRVIPFRGAYLHLAPSNEQPVVKGMIYPVPDPTLPFLGVHITKHIDGSISIGPTAFIAGAKDGYELSRLRFGDLLRTFTWPGTWRVAGKFWKTALTELGFLVSRRAFVRAAAEFVPDIKDRKLLKGRTAGVRAQAVDRNGTLVDDFVISHLEGATHVRNAPSPAATSGMALASYVVDSVETHLK